MASGCEYSSSRERSEMSKLALDSFDQGIVYAEAGNDIMALEYLERSISMVPTPAGYFEAGRTLERLGQIEGAFEYYNEALDRAAGDYPEARFAMLAMENRPEVDRSAQREAAREVARLAALEKMTDANEARMPTLAEVRDLLFSGQEDPSTLPSATDPTYPLDAEIVLTTYTYHLVTGQRLETNQNFERAALEYREALRSDPARMEARLRLGDVMLKMERHQQAYLNYNQAKERFPESPEPLLKMGNYYDALNREDFARDFYAQALFLDPDYPDALNNLGALEIRARNYAKAVELLEHAIEGAPDYALAYLNLGIALEESGDRTGALAAYRKHVQLGGSQSAEVGAWIAEME